MDIKTLSNAKTLGTAAGLDAAKRIRRVIQERGSANIIIATGASQFDTLNTLTAQTDIDWSKVTVFHLDEYVGMAKTHPASFVKYLQERFVDKVQNLKCMNFVNGAASDPVAETKRLDELIQKHPIDIALVGIGENAHLAFNDPPADFETEKPYLIVELDEACRKQQLGEGWFPDLNAVPKRAISMSIRHILKSGAIIVSVPDKRKAAAVAASVNGPLTNLCPSSILRQHPDCILYLDEASASAL